MKQPRSSRSLRILFLLVLTAFFGAAKAQVQTAKYVSMASNTNAYFEYLPQGYDSGNETYPLILFIHGVSELGDGSPGQMSKLLYTGLAASINVGELPVSLNVNGQTHKFIVISPQFINWPSPQDVNSVLDYIVSHYRVNTSRIYLTGLSMGGGVVWDYVGNNAAYANRIAAIVPIAGASWPDHTRARTIAAANVAVWAWHNNGDPTVPSWYTDSYVDQINEAPSPNPQARKTIMQSGSHDAWTFTYNSTNRDESGKTIYQWMLQYSKGTPPPPSNNQLPVANAGPDQTITTSSTQLNGSGTDPDGTIASYTWSKVSGPAQYTLSSTSVANPTLSNLIGGVYTFRLRVTDNGGATAYDDVVITVTPGIPGKVEAESFITMNGIQVENTADVGGGQNIGWQDTNDWMDYNVNVTGGGTFTANFRVATQFTGAQFQLRKSDGTVLKTITVPNTGGFQNWQTVSTTVNLPAGNQTLRIFTSNAAGGWNFNWMEFLASAATTNQPPVANAGPDQAITLPANSVTLNGSGTDPDGTITAYAWTKLNGPAATITSASSASTTVTGLVQGTYTFRLTVTDNAGATAYKDVMVTVNNTSAPSSSLRIEAENYTSMFGVRTENTSDAGGGLNVAWLDDNDWMDYSVNLSAAGTYTLNFRVATEKYGAQLQLRKSDGTVLSTINIPYTGGFQNWQTVSTTASLPAGQQTLRLYISKASGGYNINWWEIVGGGSATNTPPVVTATDQTITLPTNSVILSATASDPDGTIASYAWTQVSGPTTPTFGAANAASFNISGLSQGIYTYRITVTDNGGATASKDVVVTVNAAAGPVTSLRIEAENYTAMNGIKTETTSDAGGGLNVGWIDDNDWMDYSVNLSAAGTYTVNFRVATEKNGAQFQLRKSDGTILTTVNVPYTGGFQNWQTISTTLTLPAGQQTLRIFTNRANGGYNINWWEITNTAAASVTTRAVGETEVAASTVADLNVYPNPVQDRLVLQLANDETGAMSIVLFNMSGAAQKQFVVNKSAKGSTQTYLSLGDLPAGDYLLKVSVGKWTATKKIVKL